MEMVDLDLTTLGSLNEEVRALLPSLITSLQEESDKASLNVTISFKKMKDADTAVVAQYAIKPSYPKRAQAILCRTDLTGNLKTELDPLKHQTAALFPKEA